jgi:hypothetical protein
MGVCGIFKPILCIDRDPGPDNKRQDYERETETGAVVGGREGMRHLER